MSSKRKPSNNFPLRSDDSKSILEESEDVFLKMPREKGDTEIIKQQRESVILEYFLAAYFRVTGDRIEFIEKSESPDFILSRSDGRMFGLELVRVTQDPKFAHFNIATRGQSVDPIKAIEMLECEFYKKDYKRRRPDWKYSNSTILVIELPNISIQELLPFLSSKHLPDMYHSEFEEIWLADYTETDAYDDVELFCITPKKWARYYPREPRKPYG